MTFEAAASAATGDLERDLTELFVQLGEVVHRDALMKKGLIYRPEYGVVDFTVPHFAAFMRRRYPIDE